MLDLLSGLRPIGGLELDDSCADVGVGPRVRGDVAQRQVQRVVDRLHESGGFEGGDVLVARIDERLAQLVDERFRCRDRNSRLDGVRLRVRRVVLGRHPLLEREWPRARRLAAAVARGEAEGRSCGERE